MEKVSRHLGDVKTEKILHLRERNEYSDTVCEADHDGDRNKADEAAYLKEPHQEQEYS